MPRPQCCRRISATPPAAPVFGPLRCVRGDVETLVLTLDELEALRLADLEGLYQEQAAERMGISRATFGRVVEQARRKVAEALVGGKALRIEGGVVAPVEEEARRCPRCHSDVGDGAGRGQRCASCAPGTGGRARGCGRK